MLISLEAVSRRVSNWLALLGLFGLMALATLTITNVMSRWLFNSQISWAVDIYHLLVAFVVTSFLPSAFAHRGHISIKFLSSILPDGGRWFLNLLSSVATLCFVVILAWQLCLYTIDVIEVGETTWLAGLPVGPWWVAITALAVSIVPIQAIVLLHDAIHGPPSEPASHEADSSQNELH